MLPCHALNIYCLSNVFLILVTLYIYIQIFVDHTIMFAD